jgi:capsular exopolysaccharide synthesis family protein
VVSGAGAAGLAELFRGGLTSAAEVAEAFGLPDIGELPTLLSTLDGEQKPLRLLDPVDYISAKPLSYFAETFRNLRTALVASRPGINVKVVAITSALPGEGKTTVAMCLARTMALAGARVVLVDCDLRRRSIGRWIEVAPSAGLVEVLKGTARLDEALVKDAKSDVMLLPQKEAPLTPSDLFGGGTMDRLLDELRARADFVILDAPPVLALSDARVLCPKADAVLMLARWRRTPRRAVLAALKALNPEETFIAGIALSQVNLREQSNSGEGDSQYYRRYVSYYRS